MTTPSTSGTTGPPAAVTVSGLRKAYGRTVAVDAVDLTVRDGETLGILGTNGAGKTTTVEMIAGLTKPDSGEISILGVDPHRDRRAVRQLLGVQLQNAAMHYNLTCEELVRLYRSFYPRPLGVTEALALVELTGKAGTRWEDLSGGQAQRLSIAIALIGRPRVVILDELTTGLDPRARRRIRATIASLTTQTILLVSHAMDEVEELCDRVVILDAGRVIAAGTTAEIRALAGARTLEDAFVGLTGRRPGEHEDEDYEGDEDDS